MRRIDRTLGRRRLAQALPDRRHRRAPRRARPSATTTSCRTGRPTPRPAPRSPTRCGTTACSCCTATRSTSTCSSASSTTASSPASRSTATGSSTRTRSPPTASYTFNQGQKGRSAWFDCSCCPTNVVRFIPSIAGYVYAQRERDVYVNLFVAGRGELSLDGVARAGSAGDELPVGRAGPHRASSRSARGVRPARPRARLGAGPPGPERPVPLRRDAAAATFSLAVNGAAA